MQIEQIEQALQAPVMDGVALSERVQTLQDKPEGRIYTPIAPLIKPCPWAIPTLLVLLSNSFAIGILYCSPVDGVHAVSSDCCCSPSKKSASPAATATTASALQLKP